LSEQREPDAATASDDDKTSQIDHEKLAGLVHAFISMMQLGNIQRLDVEQHDLRISLRAHGDATSAATVIQRMAISAPVAVANESSSPSIPSGHHIVTAPMIGTFYTSPAPNEPVFIQPGDHIDEGQTIGIIEAMKIMNEIAADRAGTVVEIVGRNAQPVEFGSPLVVIVPDVP